MDKRARKQKQQATAAAILKSVHEFIQEQEKFAAATAIAESMVQDSITEVAGVRVTDGCGTGAITLPTPLPLGCWGKFKQCWGK